MENFIYLEILMSILKKSADQNSGAKSDAQISEKLENDRNVESLFP
jgi:hypothetical protein